VSKQEKQRLLDSFADGPIIHLFAYMLLAELADAFTISCFDCWGIVPWSFSHLPGIVLMPFLHADLLHMAANSFSLVLLGVFVSRHQVVWPLTIWGVLISGALVWLLPVSVFWFSSPQWPIHIGASALVYVYLGFLLARGFKTRYWIDIAVCVFVGLLFTSTITNVFTYIPGISWEGHAFGFLTGVFLAFWLPLTRG